MVENTKNNAFAGAALLKTFMNGPQELSITDTANSISVALWTKLGGQRCRREHGLVEGASSSRACSLASRKTTSLIKVARPICMAIDRVAPPIVSNSKPKSRRIPSTSISTTNS